MEFNGNFRDIVEGNCVLEDCRGNIMEKGTVVNDNTGEQRELEYIGVVRECRSVKKLLTEE